MTTPFVKAKPHPRLVALAHHTTYFLGSRFPQTFPFVFVLGYPKSGTTWVGQLTAEYLQLPFPQWSIFPIGCPAVIHGHRIPNTKFPRGVYVVRDGRDVMVSLYFFLSRRIPQGNNPVMSRSSRRLFPGMRNKDDVRDNLPRFIEAQMARPHASPVNWPTHVESYYRHGSPHFPLLKYEDLLADGLQALSHAMSTLTGEPADPDRIRMALNKFSFERQSGRPTGQEDRSSFLRKGIVGDWRHHFSRQSAEVFDRYAGQTLITTGYEKDHAWVQACAN